MTHGPVGLGLFETEVEKHVTRKWERGFMIAPSDVSRRGQHLSLAAFVGVLCQQSVYVAATNAYAVGYVA